MLSRSRGIGSIAKHVNQPFRRVRRVPSCPFSATPPPRRSGSATQQQQPAAEPPSPLCSAQAQDGASTDSPLYVSKTPPPPPALSTLLPTNPHHTSLRTYLAHARRLALSPTSTTYAGTVYEYVVLATLRRLGIELVRIGQTGDLGVDLVGYWHLAERQKRGEAPLRVVVQCKRLRRKVSPGVVRELEGAFGGAPGGWRGEEVVGLVVGVMPTTRGVVEGLKRSRRACGWVCVEEIDVGREEEREEEEQEEGGVGRDVEGVEGEDGNGETRTDPYVMKEGKIRQVLWNQRAKEVGLEGVDVVKRFDGERDGKDEIVLMWRGERINEIKDTE